MSNNGSQHLVALTRDDVTAPHVNLSGTELGDLYMYVATHVWEAIEEEIQVIEPMKRRHYENIINEIVEMKEAYQNASQSERAEINKKLGNFRAKYRSDIKEAAPVYWSMLAPGDRRKAAKRNVMTIPYGASSYGLGQQQIDDAKKHGIPLLSYMERAWGAYLGTKVFEQAGESMERPMRLLRIFEKAGEKAEAKRKFLSWNIHKTGFKVVQFYTEGTFDKVRCQYYPKLGSSEFATYDDRAMKLTIAVFEEPVYAEGKQSRGAAPNIIHSLDACHCHMIINACDFPVSTVHDSFGSHLCNLGKLYRVVREQFVELYKDDPLLSILKDIDSWERLPEINRGTFDITSVLKSEFSFI